MASLDNLAIALYRSFGNFLTSDECLPYAVKSTTICIYFSGRPFPWLESLGFRNIHKDDSLYK